MEVNQDEYMKDPQAKSVAGFIVALNILAKYMPDGLDESHFSNAEHDIFAVNVGVDVVTQEDADKLNRLGWHPSSEWDSWAYFT
jgi:hypothetical protein